MFQLTKMTFPRIMRQKILWIYLLVMLSIAISCALQILNAPADDDIWIYAGGNFPIWAIQSQIVVFSPLFMAVMAAYLVNYEKSQGMLKQSLLHGKTKIQLLNSKILILVSLSLLFMAIFFLVNCLIGLIVWKEQMLLGETLRRIVLHYLLVLIPFIVVDIGLILLTLYTVNMTVTISLVMFLLLLDNLVNNFFTPIVSKCSFLYYIYAYTIFNARPLEPWMIPQGITICLITAVVFYIFSLIRIHTMEFR